MPVLTSEYTYLRWIQNPSDGYGLHFYHGRDQWAFWSQRRLAGLARETARALAAAGIGRGDVVAVAHRSGPEFVASLFGTMLAGATCSLIAPPLAFQPADEYQSYASRLAEVARPALIVADDRSLPHLREAADALGLPSPLRFAELVTEAVQPEAVDTEIAGPADAIAGPADGGDPVLLQFTSGSTAPGRGVQVSAAALNANVSAIIGWLNWSPGVRGMSWLPTHHDMGLVGCLIAPLAAGCDVWALDPDDFIRAPHRYLSLLSELRVQVTAMPAFGLAHLMNRVGPRRLTGLDFSSLDAIVVGAERVSLALLETFHEFLAPFGLRREALLPAYGMAEATLCVTGVPLGEGWQGSCLPDGTEVTGCGRPVAGLRVRVVDDDGMPVPDRAVGEIVVTGDSVADCYVGPAGAGSTRLADGELRTGDAGFLSAGQLFVLGRMGDGVKIRGKMVFAESIEAALYERGVPARRAVALLGLRGDVPVAAVVLENPRDGWRLAAQEVLSAQASGAEQLTLIVRRGSIPVTSSGKPRRRAMWQALTEGRLDGPTDRLAEATTARAPGPAEGTHP